MAAGRYRDVMPPRYLELPEPLRELLETATYLTFARAPARKAMERAAVWAASGPEALASPKWDDDDEWDQALAEAHSKL